MIPAIDRLSRLDDQLIFVPVRHHSPIAARTVQSLINAYRPTAVLIEGPSDYNLQLDDLWLNHQPPIAIYSYVRFPHPTLPDDEIWAGALYPFCVFSPEWVALQTAHKIGAQVQFIDLPWADQMASEIGITNRQSVRYNDTQFTSSLYLKTLCAELGVEGMDVLWDMLFEIPMLAPAQYMRRAHEFCTRMRLADGKVDPLYLRREAYMAEQIRQTLATVTGQVMVVTGGYHSLGLIEQLESPTPITPVPPFSVTDQGVALTPFSYERLDSLKGYEAGMPNPGFYHAAWRHPTDAVHRELLAKIATELMQRRQTLSTADLIAVESTAQSLAALRGHPRVWRNDLLDGLLSALVKEDLPEHRAHPLLEAVYQVFRGEARGALAPGTSLPALVHDVYHALESVGLTLPDTVTRRTLTLTDEADLARSRVLWRIAILGLRGIAAPPDNLNDELLAQEEWGLRWQPEFDATCVEKSVYGATLEEATRAILKETFGRKRTASPHATQPTHEFVPALHWLMYAIRAGLSDSAEDALAFIKAEMARGTLQRDVEEAIGTLARLLYLYRYSQTLKTLYAPYRDVIESALHTTFYDLVRGISTHQFTFNNAESQTPIQFFRAVIETYQQAASLLDLTRETLSEFIYPILEVKQSPLCYGAAAGALWSLGDADAFESTLHHHTSAADLGDYLTGVFALAREEVKHHPGLISRIDRIIGNYDDAQFMDSLPSLRLAFTQFSPREQYYLTQSLFGGSQQEAVSLTVDTEQVLPAMALEAALYATLERYGLR